MMKRVGIEECCRGGINGEEKSKDARRREKRHGERIKQELGFSRVKQ